MNLRILIIALFFGNVLAAQNSVDAGSWYPKERSDSKVSYRENINFNMQTGASFTNFGRNYSGYNYYVSPSATIPVNKDFSFTFGMMVSQFTTNGPIYSGEGNLVSGANTRTQAIIYGSGVYRVNPNVTVYASGYYDVNARNMPQGMRQAPNYFSPYGSEGFTVGSEIKIGERTRIGIEISYDKGGNPYFNRMGGAFRSPGMGLGFGPY
jgi:hypothetical protein